MYLDWAVRGSPPSNCARLRTTGADVSLALVADADRTTYIYLPKAHPCQHSNELLLRFGETYKGAAVLAIEETL